MLLLWVLYPVVLGMKLDSPNERFLQLARQELNLFHQELFPSDSIPLYSHHAEESSHSKKIVNGAKNNGSKEKKTKNAVKGSKSHNEESRRTGKSEREKHTNHYGNESKKKGDTYSENGKEGEHYSSKGGMRNAAFKDRLLHKAGNYEKGYRDVYHMDELVKHNNFWNKHDSQDQYHKYGDHDGHFHEKKQEAYKGKTKKEKEEQDKNGKKTEKAGGHSHSEHGGHKTKGGTESKYENKEEYDNSKSDTPKHLNTNKKSTET